ncbi:MAG TPA: dockerin type I domain-containing protein, partial [Pirellulales bacterium]|nr:dockerin type I domain-containing protein [Pirellulales bacterium]
NVFIDINGNMVWDPQGQNNDSTNRDLNFSLAIAPGGPGYGSMDGMGVHDTVFAGNFPSVPGGPTANGFSKLGAYGFDPLVNGGHGGYRWLIDTDGNGIINSPNDIAVAQPAVSNFDINAIPVAGNFDGNAANGDEVGLFNGTQWLLDTDHDFGPNSPLDSDDTLVSPGLSGAPIVGSFTGNHITDLATYKNGVFYFAFGPGFSSTAQITFGLPGNAALPVAADMNQDGITDIGLFLPGKTGVLPQSSGNWEFLVSNPVGELSGVAALNAALNHPFQPTPLGNDIFAQFGDAAALPIVGLFDPPVAAQTLPTPSALAPLFASTSVSASVTTGGNWYSFEPLRSGTVSVSSTIASAGTNLSIDLYDANYNSLAGASANGVGQASLSQAVTAGQTYLVRLTGNDAAATVNISNSVSESDRCDTTRDGQVNASDLLRIINYLNANGPHTTPQVLGDPNLYLDTNLDGNINAQDALTVINYLLDHTASPSVAASAMTSAAASVVPDASSAVAIGLTLAASSSTQSTSGQSRSAAPVLAPVDAVYSQIGSVGTPASAMISDPSAAGSTATSAASSAESSEMAIDASLAGPNWDPLG